jgi:hypothetical protein
VREAALAGAEGPPPVPLSLPRRGERGQLVAVGDLLGAPFDDNVDAGVPRVRSRGQSDVRVGREVERLLLLGAGAEVQRAVVPDGDQWRDVRAAIGAHGRDPEQLGLRDPRSGLVPREGGRARFGEALIEVRAWLAHVSESAPTTLSKPGCCCG